MGTLRFINAFDLSTLSEIRMDGSRIQYSTAIKYLDVTIMNTLSCLLLIYPHVDYCCVACTDMTTEHNLRLHRAVNACVRFIFKVRADEHIIPYYVRLCWLKVDVRRAYFVRCLLYKILETKQLSLLHSYFNCMITTTDRATRSPRYMLFLSQCRTELYKRSFRLTSARFRNGLSQSIRSATTDSRF
ncbi:hypothetical protein ACFW04_014003 [Cataglyphis niger]